jgi:MFS transporter, CP family, cyanate transporter
MRILAPLAALFLVSLTLRFQLIGVAPLLPLIQDEFAARHAVVGLLSTIPVLCMGLFAFPASWIARRFGTRNVVAASVATLAAFGALRAAAPDVAWLILLTFGVGVGIGVAGAVLPVVVKERFPRQAGLVTGMYATGIQLGSAGSAAVAVPIAVDAGWRGALLLFAVVTALLAAMWLGLIRDARTRQPPGTALLPALPLRSALAWHLVAIFALTATSYYGLNTWIPSVYVDRGWDEVRAGTLVAVLNAAALPSSLLVPWLSDWQYLKENDDFNQTFDVALHLGTLLAVVAYFWAELAALAAAWLRSARRRRG